MTDEYNPDELHFALGQFHGSASIFVHPLFRMRYSEGVRFLAEKAGAYWLLEAIMSYKTDPKVRREPFQVWKLAVKDSAGLLTCTDGNDNQVASQRIEHTDFPLSEIVIWVENDTLVLPAER